MKFILTGQMVSGKNQIQLAFRYGRIIKYPNKRFEKWRTEMLGQIAAQHSILDKPFDVPVWFAVQYFPGDLRRRDMSGMLDALFHLMEAAQIVKDDCLFKECRGWQTLEMNRAEPRLIFELDRI